MDRIRKHLTFANVVSVIALFVALGGTTYAATSLPAGSVGTRQLRNGAVTPPKLDHRLIGGYVRAWATTNDGCQLVGSARHGAHPRPVPGATERASRRARQG